MVHTQDSLNLLERQRSRQLEHTTPVVSLDGCRRALHDEVANLAPSLFVTLAFNRKITLPSAFAALDAFHARVDRKLLGHDWHKRVGRRTRFIAVAENTDTNLHLHLLVAPADGEWWKFSKVAVQAWSRIAPAGDTDVTPVSYAAGAMNYMTKKLALDTFDRVQFSRGY